MELTLTTITSNRALGKAFTRLGAAIQRLDVCAADIDTKAESFDILQVVLVDQAPSHVAVQRTPRGSRILQIHVGIPAGQSFKPDQDVILLGAMGDQVLKALEHASLPDAQRREVARRVGEWKNSIHGLLGREPVH